MRARDRHRKEKRDIQSLIIHLFPTFYTKTDQGKDYTNHVADNLKAIQHRQMLSEIANTYDGSNYETVIFQIRSKAKRIIQYNGVF